MKSVNFYITNKGIKEGISAQENQKLKAALERALAELYRHNNDCINVEIENQISDKKEN